MLIDPALHHKHQSDRNKVMELHALHFSKGGTMLSTMLSTTIKTTTMKHYLKIVSSIPLNHTQLDPLSHARGL